MTLVLFKMDWSSFGTYTLRQAQDDKGFKGEIMLEWFWMPAVVYLEHCRKAGMTINYHCN